MAIDQSEIAVTPDGQDQELDELRVEAQRIAFSDPLSPADRAARIPLTAAELRQRALGNIIPIWTRARSRLSEANSELEGVKGDVKRAKAALEREESALEHVGNCRQDPCLTCESYAINPPKQAAQPIDDDDEDEEADLEPRADADRDADMEAVLAEADDQVDGAVPLEEIAARGGADRETAEVGG